MAGRWLFVLIALVVGASCAGDVTESDEYLAVLHGYEALQDEHRAIQEEYRAAKDEHQTVQDEYRALQQEHQTLQAERQALRDDLGEAHGSLQDAEAALEEVLNRPWPEEVKSDFIAGCTEMPEEGLTDEQQDSMCRCIVDALAQTVPLVDFVTYSIAIGEDAELNPITGLPSSMDQGFAEALIVASASCLLEL